MLEYVSTTTRSKTLRSTAAPTTRTAHVARTIAWYYYLQTKKPAPKKGPLMFAGVRIGKA